MINSRFCSKIQWLTDVSVGFRPPCWCPFRWHQHGVSIQFSINLGKKFLRIYLSLERNFCDLNLGQSLWIYTFFLFSDSWLYLSIERFWFFIYSEWRDTENQQYYFLKKPIKASDTLEHQPTVWPVPYACAQPYHPGSGSHGQLFRPC